jgi:hypothetical protein
MYKLFLFLLYCTVTVAAGAQKSAVNHTGKSFTSEHQSLSVTYGLSTLLNVAPFITTTTHSSEGSYAIGPLRIAANSGLSDNISIMYGLTAMYFRDEYFYSTDFIQNGHSHIMVGGVNVGFNYHFPTNTSVDPYLGAASGVSYFWGRDGADQLGRRWKGTTHVLYGAVAGLNIYNEHNNAWTIEAGYDYLSYLKIGYTFGRRK